jgi:hypothetical protein
MISFLIGMTSCNRAERDSEKLINHEKTLQNQKDRDTTISLKKNTDIQSNLLTGDTVSFKPSLSKKKKNITVEEPDVISDEFQTDETHFIVPGFIRNKFTKNGNSFDFVRTVKFDEDKRIGCSGGGNDLSFTILSAVDTFLVENEMLKTLNFKYHIVGGIYDEYGGNPYKGKVMGIFSSDNTWQIEINVWITMKDIHNKEIVRQIIVNDKFTQ